MIDKPKTLLLADTLEYELMQFTFEELKQIASELRRLHEVNLVLIEVAKMAEKVALMELRKSDGYPDFSPNDMLDAARSAIAKATGEQP